MNKNLIIKFKKLDPRAVVPNYATSGSSGVDLVAIEDIDLYPNHPVLVRTGLAVSIPFGYEGQVRPRSGLATKFYLTMPNSIGTIDSDYRGELKIPMVWNDWMQINGRDLLTPYTAINWKGGQVLKYSIHAGDRIAQLVIMPVEHPAYEEADELDRTARGTGGFGSTGIKSISEDKELDSIITSEVPVYTMSQDEEGITTSDDITKEDETASVNASQIKSNDSTTDTSSLQNNRTSASSNQPNKQYNSNYHGRHNNRNK